MQPKVIRPEELLLGNFEWQEMPEPDKILLVTPTYFDVVDVKNAYMEGQTGNINKALAREQWDSLHATYKQLEAKGVLSEVCVMQGQAELEDMVFCANQSLPWLLPDGKKVVVMSNMRYAKRQKEVEHFKDFYNQRGYEILHLPEKMLLEGNGDIIPHPGKRLLWAGYGHRSSAAAAEHLATLLQTPVILLKLINEHFYHLDTCFVPIDEKTVLLCEDAFDAESLKAIRSVFETVISIPQEEAAQTFGLNALVLRTGATKKHAIIQSGATACIAHLKATGCQVHEVETGEFMKSGGSVFCMKMMVF